MNLSSARVASTCAPLVSLGASSAEVRQLGLGDARQGGYEWLDGEAFTTRGKTNIVAPRAVETDEIPGLVEQFRKGAKNAHAAGFHGVEIYGGNGYLLDQFLRDGSDHRNDAYGGSLSKRRSQGGASEAAHQGVAVFSRAARKPQQVNSHCVLSRAQSGTEVAAVERSQCTDQTVTIAAVDPVHIGPSQSPLS
jgi:NADH:flavin oxidoreductase / NADH oxidase family